MENVAGKLNVWESRWKNSFLHLNSYEELIKHMEENDVFSFNLCDTYVPGSPERSVYDTIANGDNIHLTYTDEQHQITIINNSRSKKILINPNFFVQHKEALKDFIKRHIIEEIGKKPVSIYIPDFILDDEFVNNIISSAELKETSISILDCAGVYLTEEQLKKFSGSHLEVSLKGEKISSKYAIKYYSWSELETEESLLLRDDLSDKEVENFTYINEKCVISINPVNENDEREYVENLVRIFNILKSHNRNYNRVVRKLNQAI